jgi:hypothetical protein
MPTHSEARILDEVYGYLNRQPNRQATTQAVYDEMARRFSDQSLATREGNHQVRFAVLRLREANLMLPGSLSDGLSWQLSGALLDGDELLAEMMST